MDLVIPLSEHTSDNYLDLRYALRGFELYLQPKKVYLIGAKPSWAVNVAHIPAMDRPESHQRERNIFEKLLLYPGQEFVYGNDDHFLMQPWKEEYAYDGTLAQKYNEFPKGSRYKITLANTLTIAPGEKFYDIHCPMTMHREYLHRLTKCLWHLPWGFALKTLYAMTTRISGVQYPDWKLRQPFNRNNITGRKWFSSADGVVKDSIGVMNKMYPKPSKYEAK